MSVKRSARPSGGDPGPAGVRGARRHAQLLDGLEAIFFEEGLRAVRVEDLAQRLRCSRRTLYEIAPGKQELFLLVVERWLGRIEARALDAREEPDPERRLELFLGAAIDESRPAGRAFSADLGSLRSARAMLDAYQQRRAEGLRDVLEYGAVHGRFRRAHFGLVAQVVLQALGSLRDPRFLEDTGLSMSEAFEELGRLVRLGLRDARDPAAGSAAPDRA